MFASGFSGAFVAPLGAPGFVGPISAQRMLLRGFGVEVGGGVGAVWIRVGSRKLVGPAGKLFAFRTAESAAVWLSINTQLAVREASIASAMPAVARGLWYAKKQAQMQRIIVAVVDAAARQKSPEIAAALIAESNFCAAKWV